jgi:hypothetical protein
MTYKMSFTCLMQENSSFERMEAHLKQLLDTLKEEEEECQSQSVTHGYYTSWILYGGRGYLLS